MVTAHMLEVDVVIIPAFVIFLLFIVPLPILSRLVSKMVLALESVQVQGVSVLLCLTLLAGGLFANQFHQWNNHYGYSVPAQDFSSLSVKMEFQAKKLRTERNLYIHAMAFVLLAAIMRFARLIRENEKLRREAGAAVNAAGAAAALDGKKKQ
jgi:uncharacterized membrane protein